MQYLYAVSEPDNANQRMQQLQPPYPVLDIQHVSEPDNANQRMQRR